MTKWEIKKQNKFYSRIMNEDNEQIAETVWHEDAEEIIRTRDEHGRMVDALHVAEEYLNMAALIDKGSTMANRAKEIKNLLKEVDNAD